MKTKYSVALFENVSSVLKAEKKLKKANSDFKIIPVPKSISSECGLCIRFSFAKNKFIMLMEEIENYKIEFLKYE